MADHGHTHDAHAGHGDEVSPGKVATTVLEVGGLNWASEKAVVEQVLGRRPGVQLVEANPVSQTATVTFDTAQTSVAELRRWIEECGYHCAGQSVPAHICDPMAEPDPVDGHGSMPAERGGHEMAGTEGMPSAQEMMGHGGGAGMSMDEMVRDMRNRFLVAAIFSVPILLWSPIGRNVLGFTVAAPFGLVLRPEIAALSMSGSSLLVAVNALLLKRLRLPGPEEP